MQRDLCLPDPQESWQDAKAAQEIQEGELMDEISQEKEAQQRLRTNQLENKNARQQSKRTMKIKRLRREVRMDAKLEAAILRNLKRNG